MRHLLGIETLTTEDITRILDRAEGFIGTTPEKSLAGKVILNLFLENSTRTRLSFEMAAKRLGAEVLNMTAEGSSVKKGESFTDTLKTLAAMKPDACIIRATEEGSAKTAAHLMPCPVLNAGDGVNEHPTQALLDALTLRRRFGRLKDLRVTICGDIRHSRVAHSNRLLLEKMGAHVTLTGPAELIPEGGTPDMAAALKNADAVMALRIQKERLEKSLSLSEAEYFKAYGLTHERLALAAPHAVILHPGPMNRGVEIDGALADDPERSLILTQVEMGVYVRMACLYLMLK